MLRRPILSIALLLTLLAAQPWRPAAAAEDTRMSEGQRRAYIAKPAVVRVIEGYNATFAIPQNQISIPVSLGGMGSGFILNGDGYILTNGHVVQSTYEGEEAGKKRLFEKFVTTLAERNGRNPKDFFADRSLMQYIVNNTQISNFEHVHHVLLPNGDSFPFEIKEFSAPAPAGKDVALLKIEIRNAPTLRIGDSDKAQISDHVTVVGYPGAADTFESGILDKQSTFEASVTDGVVSARKTMQDGSPVIQISAPATHGNSGGPVLNDANQVIGLLTFRGDTINGQEVTGFSFVVPSSVALDFVKRAGITNDASPVDARFVEGLDLFNQGYYSRAIEKFDNVKSLFPQHSEVDQLLSESRQRIADGKERDDSKIYALIIVIAAAVAFLMMLAALIFFLRRGQKRPSHVAPPVPVANPYQPTPAPAGFGQPAPFSAPIASPAFVPGPPAGSADKTVVVARPPDPRDSWGTLRCISGPLIGQQFQIRPEGIYIGRDVTVAQVVVNDSRVSKRHVWVGPRNGRVIAIDQGSTNGTFLNYPGTQRIAEAFLNQGDIVILSEGDAARFQYIR